MTITFCAYGDSFICRHVACSSACSQLSQVCVGIHLSKNLTQKEKLAVMGEMAHVLRLNGSTSRSHNKQILGLGEINEAILGQEL